MAGVRRRQLSSTSLGERRGRLSARGNLGRVLGAARPVGRTEGRGLRARHQEWREHVPREERAQRVPALCLSLIRRAVPARSAGRVLKRSCDAQACGDATDQCGRVALAAGRQALDDARRVDVGLVPGNRTTRPRRGDDPRRDRDHSLIGIQSGQVLPVDAQPPTPRTAGCGRTGGLDRAASMGALAGACASGGHVGRAAPHRPAIPAPPQHRVLDGRLRALSRDPRRRSPPTHSHGARPHRLSPGERQFRRSGNVRRRSARIWDLLRLPPLLRYPVLPRGARRDGARSPQAHADSAWRVQRRGRSPGPPALGSDHAVLGKHRPRPERPRRAMAARLARVPACHTVCSSGRAP